MGCAPSADRGMGFIAEYQQAQIKKHPELADQYAPALVIPAKARHVAINEKGDLVGEAAENKGDWLEQRRLARVQSLDKGAELAANPSGRGLVKLPSLKKALSLKKSKSNAKSIPEDDPFASDGDEDEEEEGHPFAGGRAFARVNSNKAAFSSSRSAEKLNMHVKTAGAFLGRLQSVKRMSSVNDGLGGAPPPILKAAELQEVPPMAGRGVTIAWLNSFYGHCRDRFKANADFTTRDVAECVVFPVTVSQRVPYVAVPGVAVAPPECYVIHAWDRPFKELVYCLRKRFQRDPSRAVWLDLFAVPQHRTMAGDGGPGGQNDDDEDETFSMGGQTSEFSDADDAALDNTEHRRAARDRQLERNPTQIVGHVIKATEYAMAVVDSDFSVASRSWGLLELHTAASESKLELAPHLLDRSAAPSLIAALRGLSLAQSSATHAGHREEILDLLELRAGPEAKFAEALRAELLALTPVMVRRIQRTAGATPLDAAEIASLVGLVMRALGRAGAAERQLAEALELMEAAIGPDSAELTAPLNALGTLKRESGDLPGAERLFRRAARIAEASFGADDAATAVSFLNLADANKMRKNYGDATAAYRRALNASGLLPADRVAGAASFAEVLMATGDRDEATLVLMRALQAVEALPEGPERTMVLPAALLEMGSHFHATGDNGPKAEPHLRRGLDLAEEPASKNLNGEPSKNLKETAQKLAKTLGQVLKAKGDVQGAEAMFRRALTLREELLPAQHPNIASSLLHVANIVKAGGRYSEAQGLYSRALAILEKALGPSHVDVASLLINLAACIQHSHGDLHEAKGMYERALAIRKAAHGGDHVDVTKLEQVIADLRAEEMR